MNSTLTNEQLDQVVNKLKETRTDNLPVDIEFIDTYDNSNDPLEEGQGRYISDGVIIEDDTNIDFDHFENLNINLDKYVDDTIKENVSKNYDLTEEESIKFISAINRVRNNENFNVYDELPEAIKEQINHLVDQQGLQSTQRKMLLSMTAKELVKQIIADSELDSLSLDLEEAMRTLVPTPLEMYSETNREYIENEFPKVAENLKEKYPEKAQNLLNMRDGFIHAYTFETMYESLKNSKIIKNIRRSEVIWNRIDTEYKKVAGVCKFKLYSLSDLVNSLQIVGFTKTQAHRIATLFVYTYTKDIDDYKDSEQYDDIYRNSFANYFEMNIMNLAMSPDLASDFSKNIKNNLVALCEHVDTLISEREAELSNNKKKRG